MRDDRFDYDDTARTRDFILGKLREQGRSEGKVREGVTIGSGLGGFAVDHMGASTKETPHPENGPVEISYQEIFRMLNRVEGRTPIELLKDHVPGHAQKLIIGNLMETPEDDLVMAQSGREHPYQGVDLKRATFWIRVMQLMKAEAWIGSNASGILTPNTLRAPSILLVDSTLDLTSQTPLLGVNDERFGPHFPHKSDLYTASRIDAFEEAARQLGIQVNRGTYLRAMGPDYESPEQVYLFRNMLRALWEEAGAQPGENRFKGEVTGAVGMSSTYEALAARHAQLSQKNPAFENGLSLLSVATNYSASAGPNGFVKPSNHEEVKQEAAAVQKDFGLLVREGILRTRAQ